MNNRAVIRLSVLGLALASIAGFAFRQDAAIESLVLRLNVEPGKDFVYSLKSESTMSMMGQEFSTKNEMTQTYSVKKKSEEGTEIEISTKDLKITSDAPMVTEEQLAKMKETMEAAKMTLLLDEFGKPRADKKGSASRGMMSMMMAAGAGGSAAFEFPKEPVQVGTTWTSELDLSKMLGAGGPAGANMKAEKPILITYTVEKIEMTGDKTVVTIKTSIDGKTDMKLPPEATAQGGPESITIENKTEATSEIDGSTGLLIKMTSTAKNSVTLGAFGEMTTSSKLTMSRS